MAHTRRDKAYARLKKGLPIKRKEKLLIDKSDDRHYFLDQIEIDNAIKYKKRFEKDEISVIEDTFDALYKEVL